MKDKKFTYEKAVEKIDALDGKPVAIEALWDGDTGGWSLSMFVFMKMRPQNRSTSQYLGTVTFEGDIELIQGKVPMYPESIVAQEIGEKLKQKYEIEFFFPSPDNASDDCPRWDQKHLAIHCGDCNKLIIPTHSPYLPKDICYHCHLTREGNQRIINEEPNDDGITMYLHKDGHFQSLGYSSELNGFKIASFINLQTVISDFKPGINIVTLAKPSVKKIVQDLEEEIDRQILEYEAPKIEKRRSKFITIDKVRYKEKEFKLMNQFNTHHKHLSGLISSWETAQKAYTENYEYKIYFKKGVTCRDDAVLRFINYPGKGRVKLTQIYEKFKGIISTEEVYKTLQKLENMGGVKLEDDEAEVTEKGKRSFFMSF